MNSSGNRRILIIDDEQDFCFFIKTNLEQLGSFEVSAAYDGPAGLKMAKNFKPDLILLDIMMPRMTGMEVLKRLKEDQATMGIPVFMLTAKNDPESKQQAAQLYDEDYLVKPIPADVLKAKIDKALSRFGG